MSYPILTSHKPVPPEILSRLGITEGTIRLSIGAESLNDLKEDLAEALDYAEKKAGTA
jgi:cystathionine beta-lyase